MPKDPSEDREIVELHTSAPTAYDGFSTTTIAVVGRSTRGGNVVRHVSIEKRDYEWQTSRYLSGLQPFTNANMKLEDYVRFGDWYLFDQAHFTGLLKLAADTPARLRACDVDRVMSAAHDAGIVEDFRAWLLPQLADNDDEGDAHVAVSTWAFDGGEECPIDCEIKAPTKHWVSTAGDPDAKPVFPEPTTGEPVVVTLSVREATPHEVYLAVQDAVGDCIPRDRIIDEVRLKLPTATAEEIRLAYGRVVRELPK